MSHELTCERRVPEELLDVVVRGNALVGQRDAAGETAAGGFQRREQEQVLLHLCLDVPRPPLVLLLGGRRETKEGR